MKRVTAALAVLVVLGTAAYAQDASRDDGDTTRVTVSWVSDEYSNLWLPGSEGGMWGSPGGWSGVEAAEFVEGDVVRLDHFEYPWRGERELHLRVRKPQVAGEDGGGEG